jgi:hypothetical protein
MEVFYTETGIRGIRGNSHIGRTLGSIERRGPAPTLIYLNYADRARAITAPLQVSVALSERTFMRTLHPQSQQRPYGCCEAE